MIVLAPGGTELSETNVKNTAMLYYVTEAEAGKVEFRMGDNVKQLSKGAEVMVPALTSYTLRNQSPTMRAAIVAVIPM